MEQGYCLQYINPKKSFNKYQTKGVWTVFLSLDITNHCNKQSCTSSQGCTTSSVQRRTYKMKGFQICNQRKNQQQNLQHSQVQNLVTYFLENQPNFMKVNGDCAIVGDIHGQYYDFLKVLTKIGDVEENLTGNIVFLGDYVDRGANSVEVMTFIMALKVNYPKNVFLLRGNHESRCMTSLHNFMKQVLIKYNQTIYDRFVEAFDSMPLACLVNRCFFCVHGGISDKMMEMEKIDKIQRFKQIPLEGAFCDFIWADPVNNQNGQLSSAVKYNDSRQCSIYFGKELTTKFIQQNGIKCIIRAHQVFQEGYQKYCWGSKPGSNFPTVVTVFSAPNYCGVYGNKGAIIKIQGTNFQIKQYKQQSINNKLHSYLEVFQWSIPQISRIINQFTKAMITSIFEVYLREQFPNFKNTTHQERLKVLLSYIKNHTDILERQQNDIKKSSMFRLLSKKSMESLEIDQKDRMFNRSRDYYKFQHVRPENSSSLIHPIKQISATDNTTNQLIKSQPQSVNQNQNNENQSGMKIVNGSAKTVRMKRDFL